MTTIANTVLKRHVALTNEHGSWALLLSPLLVGLFAGGSLTLATVYLVAAALAAFLIRHPIVILVKIYSNRRSRRDRVAALFWVVIYGILALVMVAGLIHQGFGYLLLLTIPGILIFTWQLILVSRRTERRQMGIEVVASGVLALIAPAAMWVGLGEQEPIGWLLWILVWLQSAASIVYAYLRLEQRQMKPMPERSELLALGQRAVTYSTFNVVAVAALSVLGVVASLLFLPYAVQWGETLWGTFNPAIGKKPNSIGIRQTVVTTVFTILFIFTW